MSTADDDAHLSAYGLFDPDVQQCPYPSFAAMRRRAPVFEVDMDGEPVWLVSTYEHCLAVVSDPATFSSRFRSPGVPLRADLAATLRAVRREGGAYPFVATLITADPPEHTRYRKLVSRAFSPRNVARLEPSVRALAVDCLDRWPAKGSVDFLSSFAVPLPVTVIARALNVPEDDLDRFKRWSDDSMLAQESGVSMERRMEAELGILEFQRYFADQIAQRRARPRHDILTDLVQARIDDGDEDGLPVELGDAEILSILQQLLVAGNETTTKALAEMVFRLAADAELWAVVKHDPQQRRALIEECLRLGSPGLAMWRIATADTELGGVRIPEGGRLLVLYGSANRDVAAFPAGEELQLDQATPTHLAFGRGEHYCLGAALARLELSTSLDEIAERVEALSLAPGFTPRYKPSFLIRGLDALHLEVTTTPR